MNHFNHLLKDFVYLFLERREGREKEREKNISVREKHGSVASSTCPNWDWACNPGTWPELNQQTFALQADAQQSHTSQGPF